MSRIGWRRWRSWLVLVLLALGLSLGLNRGLAAEAPQSAPEAEFNWNLPVWAPRPLVPPDNPQTPEKVALGRQLFYEQRLSITGEKSCGSCHLQKFAFTDAKSVSEGATGEWHPRNAVSLTNVAYNSVLTWANPLSRSLEQQMLVPLFGENPVEMGMADQEAQILTMLRQDPNYPGWFAAAFPDQAEPISIRSLTQAIAAFERTLISFSSPYDRYRYEGDSRAISDAAKRGESCSTASS
jgi:cytochrome c peroxidase